MSIASLKVNARKVFEIADQKRASGSLCTVEVRGFSGPDDKDFQSLLRVRGETNDPALANADMLRTMVANMLRAEGAPVADGPCERESVYKLSEVCHWRVYADGTEVARCTRL